MPILQIKDENGNFIPIPAIKGDDGKSAYEQAVEGGYQGTEEQFIQALASLGGDFALQLSELGNETEENLEEHITDKSNPHEVTAEQSGAIPEVYRASNNLNTDLQQGGNKMAVCSYHSGTLNTPYTEGLTSFAHGMVITNANSEQYGTQLCIPSGENAIYVRRKNGGGISQWVRIADAEQLSVLQEEINNLNGEVSNLTSAITLDIAHIAIGTYEGTNSYGVNNPLSLTFPFVPKVVFICPCKKTSDVPFAWIYGSPVGLTAYNNGVAYTSNLTWNGNTLSWYTTDGYPSYQHNTSSTTYYWVAIG